jgi:hypothetical protein
MIRLFQIQSAAYLYSDGKSEKLTAAAEREDVNNLGIGESLALTIEIIVAIEIIRAVMCFLNVFIYK